MTTRTQVVSAARGWIGTPFHASARLKGTGVDCAGLLIGVMRELGLCVPNWDVAAYLQIPDGHSMLAQCDEYMDRITRDDMQAGDVVCLVADEHPQHLGILGDYRHGGFSIIHAANNAGRVIETRLMFTRVCRFVAAYSFRGIE